MDLKFLKQSILDQKKVLDAADRATNRALSRFGSYVRQRAKTSIRPRKGVSAAGKPPSSHVGLIRDHMLFAVETARRNVIIGPMKLNKPSETALSSLEHGGPSIVMRKGKPVRIMVSARPFMQPAFDIEIKKAPHLWANSLR